MDDIFVGHVPSRKRGMSVLLVCSVRERWSWENDLAMMSVMRIFTSINQE